MTTPTYTSCKLKTFSIPRWQKDKLLPLQAGELLANHGQWVRANQWTDYSLRNKWFCKHGWLLLSFPVSTVFSPSDYSSHFLPSFSRQQIFNRNNSHLQSCLVLAFNVSVLVWPQVLGQTKHEPSEGPSFPVKHTNYRSQHNRRKPSPLSDVKGPNMLCTNDFFTYKFILSVTKHMQSNFLNVWILPSFAVMNIYPSAAFLTLGSDKFLESRTPELLGNEQVGGNTGHNIVLKPFSLELPQTMYLENSVMGLENI